MPFELFLALRYLYSRRRRKLARVTALAAVAGVGFGVAAIIIALALANGFRDEMRDKILRGTAHITLMRRDAQPMNDWRAVADKALKVEGVVMAYPTTYDGALLSGPSGSGYGILRGVDPSSKAILANIGKAMIAGNIESLANQPRPQQATGDSGTNGSKDEDLVPDLDAYKQIPSEAALPNVILGAELAARTGLDVGGIATLVSSESTLTPLGVAPRYRRVRVGGIFRYGLFEYDSTWIYLPLEQASSFAGLPQETAGFVSIETNDIYNASRISAALREKLGAEYSTVDWQEANRPLFAALALERRMALFIIGLIVFVAVLNITSTLILVVVERRNDIAILGAMGTSGASITAIFVIEGAVIGLAGAVAGVILGFFASAVGNYYKLVGLPPDVYSVSNVPFHFHVRDALLAALVAFALSVIATIYPARAAARIRPADALRD